MSSFPNLLVVDVGNTATSFGLFKTIPFRPQPKPFRVWTQSTALLKTSPSIQSFLKKKISFRARNISGVIISSVVPSVDRLLAAAVKKAFHQSALFIDGRINTKVRNRYKNPREVGADRIVNARAAIEIVKGPSIVVDFGTATTFDCITKRGEYLGGVISPGPVISAEALYQRTAKLPLVLLERPAKILGRTTLESMQSGLYHGYRGLVMEIVTELKKKLGPRTKVLSTGGQAHWILRGLGIIDKNIPHLTLMGLYHVWHDLNSDN